jgi:hypothetical protein
MTIRRAIIPVILALGTAGSIMAGSTVPAMAAQAPAAHVLSTTSHASSYTYVRGTYVRGTYVRGTYVRGTYVRG